MCTAFYNFQLTFQLIISSDLQKQKSVFILYIGRHRGSERTESLEVIQFEIKASVSKLYLLTTHYCFAILSKQYTRLGTWLGSVQTCYLTALFLCLWQLCLFHSSLTLLPFLIDWDINKLMAQHPDADNDVSLNWLAALKVKWPYSHSSPRPTKRTSVDKIWRGRNVF